MKKIIVTTIGLGIVVIVAGFLLIQLVPYGHNHTDPPVVQEPRWDSPATRELAKRACFDCHSNESNWPWYSNIAPASWLVQHDVDEGRARLNFSDWQNNRQGEGGESLRELSRIIERGRMPPSSYILTHPQAKLTETEKLQLINGLNAIASAP